jgi:uncharacterized protein (TIGR03000 family)
MLATAVAICTLAIATDANAFWGYRGGWGSYGGSWGAGGCYGGWGSYGSHGGFFSRGFHRHYGSWGGGSYGGGFRGSYGGWGCYGSQGGYGCYGSQGGYASYGSQGGYAGYESNGYYARSEGRVNESGYVSQSSSPTLAQATTKTTLTLRVPAEAKVTLAGVPTRQTGAVRQFSTRNLAAGQDWKSYKVVVEVERDGQTLREERSITLVGGVSQELDIEFDNEQIAKL